MLGTYKFVNKKGNGKKSRTAAAACSIFWQERTMDVFTSYICPVCCSLAARHFCAMMYSTISKLMIKSNDFFFFPPLKSKILSTGCLLKSRRSPPTSTTHHTCVQTCHDQARDAIMYLCSCTLLHMLWHDRYPISCPYL